MKGLQDIMMYGCLITLCSLCLLLSDRTVQAKNIPDDSIHSDSLDIKDLGNIEKPSSSSAEKRKWADYSSWGKRRWDGNASWGKRWSEGLTSWGKRNADKRQWNQFLTWGKRNADADKRKDWSSFATWGKRGKWSNFSSWGKRDLSTDALENAITDAVISRFDDDGDHGLNRDEMLAFVGWLRATGAAAEPVLYSNH